MEGADNMIINIQFMKKTMEPRKYREIGVAFSTT